MATSDARSVWDRSFVITEGNFRIRYEQLRARLTIFPFLVLSQMLIEPLFVWMFWAHADHLLLSLWIGFFYLLHIAELIRWNYYCHQPCSIQGCRDCHLFLTYASLSKGLLWGIAAVMFFPARIEEQILLICVMLGLTTGAIATNPVHPPSLYGYVAGILLPLLSRLFFEINAAYVQEFVTQIQSGNRMVLVALMLMIFIALTFSVGRKMYRNIESALQQRFITLDLAEALSQQQAHAEAERNVLANSNAELHQHETQLEHMVLERTEQLQQRVIELDLMKEATIATLASLAEIRDTETGSHIC